MKKEFIILLPNEKARTYGYITMFILIINVLVFGFFFINAIDEKVKNISLMGSFISCVSLLFFFLNYFTKKFNSYRIEISFIILSILWFILSKYLAGFCVLCFAVIGIYTSRKFNVIISENGIRYPSFPVKIFLWPEVSNLLLKDNVLTIDLKNNKLIQVVIDKISSNEINETVFNAFCKEQMVSQFIVPSKLPGS